MFAKVIPEMLGEPRMYPLGSWPPIVSLSPSLYSPTWPLTSWYPLCTLRVALMIDHIFPQPEN